MFDKRYELSVTFFAVQNFLNLVVDAAMPTESSSGERVMN